MTKHLLIDALHPEETRVVVTQDNAIDTFDFESNTRRPLRGNIYLAKITRVEPSLQAAFVEYGGNRHGFLAFGEIHPDYYQIPLADREALLREQAEAAQAAEEESEEGDDPEDEEDSDEEDSAEEDENVEDIGGDEEAPLDRTSFRGKYKIQEVIKRNQIILVQAVKEERGNKGAALTTYISLAGRYCVLMPNSPRGGGISRKISQTDRKKLSKIVEKLDVPDGMGLIVRTAGSQRTLAEIRRDWEYLSRAWESVRETTLESTAPMLIYEEGNLIRRCIRDIYGKDFEDVTVQGEEAYKEARDYMKLLMPSHARKVKQYDGSRPLFTESGVEDKLAAMFNPVVALPSGGYLVINQTEALVAIDVNSGKATRKYSIEETALNTNLEAAEEVARQAHLRDLAGLLVVDFIDMDERRNNQAVEKRLKQALKNDRARIQIGRISSFGLLEMSRQRMRAGVLEGSSRTCPHCNGSGMVRSVESRALYVLRSLEEKATHHSEGTLGVHLPEDVAVYLLNHKATQLHDIGNAVGIEISVMIDRELMAMEMAYTLPGESRGATQRMDGDPDAAREEAQSRPRKRRGGGSKSAPAPKAEAAGDEGDKPKRRRGRRGGRKRRKDNQAEDAPENAMAEDASGEIPDEPDDFETKSEDSSAATEEFGQLASDQLRPEKEQDEPKGEGEDSSPASKSVEPPALDEFGSEKEDETEKEETGTKKSGWWQS